MPFIKAKPYHDGMNAVICAETYPKAGMSFGVLQMKRGDKFRIEEDKELALLLMFGKVNLQWEEACVSVERGSCFCDAPYCLCTAKGVVVGIECLSEHAQLAVMLADNDSMFESKLYTPQDCPNENRGEGLMNEVSTRIVRTIRGKSDCKETHFFMGEVVNFPGKWSSFPPHSHPHPEIYYYKFLPGDRHGFGFSQEGYDTAHVVKEGDALLALDGDIHAQVAAPGYAMYYVWVIRDDDANPYCIPQGVAEYNWITHAKFFPEADE